VNRDFNAVVNKESCASMDTRPAELARSNWGNRSGLNYMRETEARNRRPVEKGC